MTSIGSLIDSVIAEAMAPKNDLHQVALREKEKQNASSGSDEGGGDELDLDLFIDDDDDNEEESNDKEKSSKKKIDPNKTSKTMTDDMEAMKTVPELEEVIEKINILRSGQSLKDEEIAESFRQYFESLSKAEKVALFVFLKGMSQIVTGEFTGEEAADPADDPAKINMTRTDKESGEDVQRKSVKPNVIKKPSPPETKKTSNREEDISPPTPIKPKG